MKKICWAAACCGLLLFAVNIMFASLSCACTEPITFIHDIQGSGESSPMEGAVVTIKGVVVGDFQTSSRLKGFFVQEEEPDFDGSSLTSEGIFVYDGSSPTTDVEVGDLVCVKGTVAEYYI